MQILPFDPSVAQQRVVTSLDDYPCILGATWIQRAGLWLLDVMEVDETPIAMGIAMVQGVFLGRRCTHRIFAGRGRAGDTRAGFLMWDLTRSGVEAGYDDLGVRVLPVYLTELDVYLSRLPLPQTRGTEEIG